MKKLLAISLLFFLFLEGTRSQTLTPDQLGKDLRIFRSGLESFHPEMYRYTDAATFEKLFTQVEKKISQPMTQEQFYMEMNPLIVALKDGHTKWIVQGKDQYYPFYEEDLFPLQLYFEGNKAFIISHLAGESVPELAEVKKINGIETEELINSLLSNLSFGDGESLGGKYYQLNNHFSAVFATFFGVKAVYEIELVLDGEKLNWKGSGISKAQIEKKNKDSSEPFSYELLNGTTAILDINRFFTHSKEPDLKKFLKNSFRSMKENEVKNLILDLRGNEGGIEKYGVWLYQYLAKSDFDYYNFISVKPNLKTDYEIHTSKIFSVLNGFSKNSESGYRFTKSMGLKSHKPAKNAFEGELIVLIDGQCFSVTTEFAARVKSDQRGYFIGQETAGGYALNSSGFFTIITLPNSKIDLGVPRLGFHMADLNPVQPLNRGILPDLEVIPSAKDILNGKDPVMEKALVKISN
ncbi:MAG: S41 family peptidase [Algoriphagus sp.]|nr:S41 family peptidase [Algoriphagus sp.]